MLDSLGALLARKHDTPHPTVISLGQVWVDIMMDVNAMPKAGGFAVSNHTMPSIGGSFRAMHAASRMGATTRHAGIIGTGPWASMIRDACADAGIEHIGQDRIDADSGFRLVLNDGERKTFIATYGAEAQGNETTFDCVEPGEGDVVHISGNTLMDHSAAGIDAFVDRTIADPSQRAYRIVLNPTNTLHMVSDQLLEDLVLARPIWSCNRQEARTLAERLGVSLDDTMSMTVGGGFDESMKSLCSRLGTALRAPLVVRAGSRGAWVRTPGGDVEYVAGYPTKAKHTRSAGACHTGAMCALLARGWSLRDAVQIANAAASLAIQRSVNGVPDCPDFDEAIALVERTEDVARRKAE
ncbi:PfkB family carbohydrate kinase [Bifidobacterium leontopitheci]|uniref:Sugar kinase n=1 Tax=Bifidobacterium leontopitheci TaxID=2650774 RepID=A0A6I1GE01_9BIFI|nr:PfkB family carbohydrate kinase [Bifidobacterium leontopitheci]KAB7789860.1 sugar kinase [Bifidobacterium leontopitheci]